MGNNIEPQREKNTPNLVKVEYTGVALILRPVVFKEGNMYCCILGPNPQEGVMGCGDTPNGGVSDWDARLKDDQYIVTHSEV